MADLAALLAAVQSQPWQNKLAGVAVYTLASAFALRASSSVVAGPARRLTLSLLFVAGNAAVPLVFHRKREGVSVAFSAFILTWLASFKALALAVGRGEAHRVVVPNRPAKRRLESRWLTCILGAPCTHLQQFSRLPILPGGSIPQARWRSSAGRRCSSGRSTRSRWCPRRRLLRRSAAAPPSRS